MKELDKRHLRGQLSVMSAMSFTSNNTGCKHICFRMHTLLLYFIWAIQSDTDTVHSTWGHSRRLKRDSFPRLQVGRGWVCHNHKEIQMLFIRIDTSLGCHVQQYLLKAGQRAVKNHIPSIRLDIYEKQRITVYWKLIAFPKVSVPRGLRNASIRDTVTV